MRPTLHGQCSYATEAMYSRGTYSQYNQRVVGILAAPQVSHCLREAFGSHHRQEGQLSQLIEYTLLPIYSTNSWYVGSTVDV